MPYSERLQDRIARLFIDVVREKHPDVAAILAEKLALVDCAVPVSLPRFETEAAAQRLLDHVPPALHLALAEMDAKLIDVQWRCRKASGIVVVNAVNALGTVRSGDTFAEVIERFCRQNLSPAEVQQLVQYACVWPSLTTHPTNPTSLAYTHVGLALDRLLADPATRRETLLSTLREVRDTAMHLDYDPVTGGLTLLRKTPALEGEELLLILNVIYESAVALHDALRAALDRFNYTTVEIPCMLDVNVWGPGDGDGNPNMTAPVLEAFVHRLRAAIRQRYVNDLCIHAHRTPQADSLIDVLNTEQATDDDVERAIMAFLTSMDEYDGESNHLLARQLRIRYQIFRTRFAGIDIRHNSVDLMTTYAALRGAFSSHSPAEFLALAPAEQAEQIRAHMADEAFLAFGAALPNDDTLVAAVGEVAARVFGRLRVVARHPAMFAKLIIAETRCAANALAAVCLLRLAGNTVAAPGARVSIVPLFESRDDLINAQHTMHILATDPTFARHLEAIGYFLVMIAKSDTTRLSGPGVTGCQEETIGKVLSFNKASYGAFDVHVFIGGGDDQMRGGGRIVETPHVVMLAAQREGARQACKVAMTIQGQQMQLVFGSTLLAGHFLEGFAAQQMLAAARIRGFHPYRPVPSICNMKAADYDAHAFFHAAMNSYEAVAGLPSGTEEQRCRRDAIVAYFRAFPSAIIGLANKSSRPLSRKATNDPLEGRAISLDQLAKHDGAYITATLGVTKALRALQSSLRCGAPEKPGIPLSPLRHCYLANKTFRDFTRMQAVVLYQKDFTIAWANRGGPPASQAERAALEEEYLRCLHTRAVPPPRAFLAHIESNDHAEAALLVEALTGTASPDGAVDLRAPLLCGWPELAAGMEYRRRQSCLATLFEQRGVAIFTRSVEEPSGDDSLLAYYGYIGANPKYSTPSFSLTMTDPQKEATGKMSETLVRRLPLPAWGDDEHVFLRPML